MTDFFFQPAGRAGGGRQKLSALLAAVLVLWPASALAGDAASFDPSEAAVSAKSISSVPVGTIIAWPVDTDPDDAECWLDCQGQTVSASDYPDLVAALTGSSESSSASLPDLRGLFLRGAGEQTFSQNTGSANGTTETTYASGDLMTVQGDALRQIYGQLPAGGSIGGGENINNTLTGVFSHSRPAVYPGLDTVSHTVSMMAYFDSSLVLPTDNEIRPVNMAVRYLIRAK